MSTAILISGQLRTFSKCWPTARWHVLRHFSDPHFFITVQDECNAGDIDILRQEYGYDHVHADFRTDPDLTAQLTPELSRAYNQAPYANAAPAHQLLLQHWYQQKCWGHFQLEGRHTEFDTIIRLRSDLWFHSFDYYTGLFDGAPEPNECWTPWWGRFGGINDRFAIMGPEAAKYYFTTYEAIPELLAAGCPFHPESLVAANLERGNIDLHPTLKTEFSTLRLNGEQRWPEITSVDLAHAALRAA